VAYSTRESTSSEKDILWNISDILTKKKSKKET
jgi:hypothetical protein